MQFCLSLSEQVNTQFWSSFLYVLVRKTKWISKNNIEGLNVFAVYIMSFYFWIEMSNGNDLVLAQLIQLIKGYHEPRVLLSALTPIISWRPYKIVSSFEKWEMVCYL